MIVHSKTNYKRPMGHNSHLSLYLIYHTKMRLLEALELHLLPHTMLQLVAAPILSQRLFFGKLYAI